MGNEPAFPYVISECQLKDHSVVRSGLTKREYFAAMAMRGMTANSVLEEKAETFARSSVRQADALIAAFREEFKLKPNHPENPDSSVPAEQSDEEAAKSLYDVWIDNKSPSIISAIQDGIAIGRKRERERIDIAANMQIGRYINDVGILRRNEEFLRDFARKLLKEPTDA